VERHGHDPRLSASTTIDTEIVEEVSLGNTHRLFMRAPALSADIAEPYVFEVDVPAHPYQVLGITGRRDWRIGLTAEHTWLVPRGAAEAT
jgi:hypothetical protein